MKIETILAENMNLQNCLAIPLSETNNPVFRVKAHDSSDYLLKCFDATRADAYHREIAMRRCRHERERNPLPVPSTSP